MPNEDDDYRVTVTVKNVTADFSYTKAEIELTDGKIVSKKISSSNISK